MIRRQNAGRLPKRAASHALGLPNPAFRGELVLRPKRLFPGEGRKRLEKMQHQQRLNHGSGLALGNQA